VKLLFYLILSFIGVSLLSQLAMLMKAQFTKQNTFPIDFLAIGASYQQKSLSIQQNLKASLLNVNANQNQSMSSFYSTAYCLIKFLRCLRIECTFENVKSENLQSYEAASISFNGVNGCLAKTSLIGKYLSERLNIQVDNEGEKYPKFAYMCHAELNFNKIYELIRE
jgi:phenylalanyl-tRNA synthetase beta subunit